MAIVLPFSMASAFGILGNIVSFLVYLAPLPTFYRICKKKSTEGFQSIPYSVALFSAMLYLYYAFLKKNAMMIVTINSVGSAIEVAYLTVYMIFATKKSRVFTFKLILLFNITLLGLIATCTYFLVPNAKLRVNIIGWICAVFSVTVFASPLSIMRKVIRTKSVEFMPFTLSFFLTICAIVWFFYGFLIKDYYIATPNIVGFVFGIAQMILYIVYKNKSTSKKPIIQPGSEAKVHDIMELKNLDEQNSENSTNKHEIEIVVLAPI